MQLGLTRARSMRWRARIFATNTLYREVSTSTRKGDGALHPDKGLAADCDTTLRDGIAGSIRPLGGGYSSSQLLRIASSTASRSRSRARTKALGAFVVGSCAALQRVISSMIGSRSRPLSVRA